MSAHKPAATKVAPKAATKPAAKPAAKVAAKPAGRAKPAPAKTAATTKPAATTTSAASVNGAAAETSDAATRLARDIDRALNEGRNDLLSEEALQALIAVVCRSYSARIEAGGNFPPLANRSRVTSTDVMVTASGLLKAANLAVFELGMWQSWTGR
jgi:outer membrane biosynthesis protein TonB